MLSAVIWSTDDGSCSFLLFLDEKLPLRAFHVFVNEHFSLRSSSRYDCFALRNLMRNTRCLASSWLSRVYPYFLYSFDAARSSAINAFSLADDGARRRIFANIARRWLSFISNPAYDQDVSLELYLDQLVICQMTEYDTVLQAQSFVYISVGGL